MRKRAATALAIAAVAVLVARDARAQGAPAEYPVPRESPSWVANRGFQFGPRVGYGIGAGVVYRGLGVDESSNGTFPILVDLGVRALPELYIGVYGQFAPVFVKTNPVTCPDGFTCSAQDWRAGVELDLHFAPRTRGDPYVGFGGGYEVLHTQLGGNAPVPFATGAVSRGRVDSNLVDRGWEFVSLTLGFDYRVNDFFGLGPFATGTLAAFGTHTGTTDVDVNGGVVGHSVSDVAHGMHEQLIVGLRGTFNH
jgi:hypothetical protein